MGKAQQYLSVSELERIAREMLNNPKGGVQGEKFSADCPFHSENTPGGSFFYNPEEDSCHCFSCGNGGDIIDIFCAVNGYGEGDPEGFKAFFELYCPDALKGGKQGERPIRKVSVPRKWEPRAKEPSPALWREKAREFVEKRNAEMLRNAEGLALLERWGITAKTAETVMLGWNPKDAFYPVTKWGLPYAENDKGRERCVWIPAGLVIPCFQRDAAGKSVLKRIKVRVSDPELAKTRKYVHVTGGEPCYGVWGRPEWRIWVVVETERDAVLLWQELGKYGIGAMGTGSASNQPDPYAYTLLSRADCVVNAMDNDAAGCTATYKWEENPGFSWSQLPQSVRWMVPSVIGKDVGDLPGAGVDVAGWLLDGLPLNIRRQAERNAGRAWMALADTPFMTFPPAERLGLDEASFQFYRDIVQAAEQYGLVLRFAAGRCLVGYAEGRVPHADADTFYQKCIRDNAAVEKALLEAACRSL
nr:MAG TPA: DNA primase, catalytic core [Caudoviricetes sp.]